VKPKDSRNSGGASSPRATATGGAWVHAPPPKIQTNREGGSATTSSPLPFLAGGGQRRYLQNTKKRKQQGFRFCLVASDLLSSVFSFWFSVLPFFRWRSALRSGRLLLLCFGWQIGRCCRVPTAVECWPARGE